MRLERHLSVLVGIMMVGGVLLTASPAMAFGQQWRPAQADDPALRSVQRLANLPGFRPHGAARPSIASPTDRRRYARRAPSMRTWQSPPVHGAWQGYPRQGYSMPGFAAFPGMPYPMTGAYPQVGWMNPYAAAAPWGQPTPMFARQFAWRPSGQPWVAQRPMAPRPRLTQPRYSARMIPQGNGFRPTVPVHAPTTGMWRPMARQAAVASPGRASRGGYPAQIPRFGANYPGFRAAPGFRPPMPARRLAAPVRLPAPQARPFWRPERAVAGIQRRHASPFRPQAYGRKPAPRTAELAVRGREGLAANRSGLPGWATTYRDSVFDQSCSWCRGT